MKRILLAVVIIIVHFTYSRAQQTLQVSFEDSSTHNITVWGMVDSKYPRFMYKIDPVLFHIAGRENIFAFPLLGTALYRLKPNLHLNGELQFPLVDAAKMANRFEKDSADFVIRHALFVQLGINYLFKTYDHKKEQRINLFKESKYDAAGLVKVYYTFKVPIEVSRSFGMRAGLYYYQQSYTYGDLGYPVGDTVHIGKKISGQYGSVYIGASYNVIKSLRLKSETLGNGQMATNTSFYADLMYSPVVKVDGVIRNAYYTNNGFQEISYDYANLTSVANVKRLGWRFGFDHFGAGGRKATNKKRALLIGWGYGMEFGALPGVFGDNGYFKLKVGITFAKSARL